MTSQCSYTLTILEDWRLKINKHKCSTLDCEKYFMLKSIIRAFNTALYQCLIVFACTRGFPIGFRGFGPLLIYIYSLSAIAMNIAFLWTLQVKMNRLPLGQEMEQTNWVYLENFKTISNCFIDMRTIRLTRELRTLFLELLPNCHISFGVYKARLL